MAGVDEVLTTLRDEYDVPEDVLKTLEGSALRKQLQDKEKELAKERGASQELSRLKKQPKRNEIFKQLGVDVDSLPAYGKKIVDGFDWDGDEPDREAVARFISENELPASQTDQSDETPPAAQAVVTQATTPSTPSGALTITPQVANEWETGKIMRFKDQHPEEFELLKRGETVVGVAFN